MIAVLSPTGCDAELVLCDDELTPVSRSSGSPAALRQLEAQLHPRWLWVDTAQAYRPLLDAGITVERCCDLALTERILLAREDRYGHPAGWAAVLSRARGEQPAADSPSAPPTVAEPSLFDQGSEDDGARVQDLLAVHADQLDRIDRAAGSPAGEVVDVPPGALRLLIAAESASALAAAEMGCSGLPFDTAVHDATLRRLLGERPVAGSRPPALTRLAARISEAFEQPVNPDSPTDLRDAFRRAGFDVDSSRAAVLRRLDHPAVAPTLEYKELQRLHSANGWTWLEQWVHDGRFHAEYLPGSVISGRWAARGGGALQIPKLARGAVRADAGFRLVVADAAQLEPRVLIALSGDSGLARLGSSDDLYSALAGVGFSGDRARAKRAMLGAMYGATAGEAGSLLATLRTHFPTAMGYLEDAAGRGEHGKLVTSVLGRTSHRPGADWWQAVAAGSVPAATSAQARRGREVARSWGRFTRNFVIQASAADWASVWLSSVRRRLRASVQAAEIVLFQHDELLVHCRESEAAAVAELITASAGEADRLVFPHAPPQWRVPVRPLIVECYADAK